MQACTTAVPGDTAFALSWVAKVRILAFETTELIGSLTAMLDGNLLCELELDPGKRSAQSLAPGMKRILAQAGWRPGDVNLVATSIGPGSFTGLRVGVTAAKTFAYSVGAEVLGVDTLEVIAQGLPAEVAVVSVAIEAQRGQVVSCDFSRDKDGWFQATCPESLIDLDAWLGMLTPGSVVAGPILRKAAHLVPSHARPVAGEFWAPKAAAVARLAARRHAAGERQDLWSLAPKYSRRSAAEEKWEKRQG